VSGNAFKPGLPLTLQAGAALVVVLVLAAWQFSRGLEKSALEDARTERLRAAPIEAGAVSADVAEFTRIRLTGRYDSTRQFLVANRPGAPLTVFAALLTEHGAFLVNRGLVNRGLVNRGLSPQPIAAPPPGTVTVIGVAWPSAPATLLAEREPWPQEWPKRVRGLHIERMATALGAQPREIRLEHGGAGVLRAASLGWDYSPGTHWGYTAQWLLIGVAVVVGYVVIGRRRGRTDA
jgi:cytochrome oxidase assembly protein ShyY1